MSLNVGDGAIADSTGDFNNWALFEWYIELGLVGSLFLLGAIVILSWGLAFKVSRIKAFVLSFGWPAGSVVRAGRQSAAESER